MKNNKVYIILLNYNGWKDAIECLGNILFSNFGNYFNFKSLSVEVRYTMSICLAHNRNILFKIVG